MTENQNDQQVPNIQNGPEKNGNQSNAGSNINTGDIYDKKPDVNEDQNERPGVQSNTQDGKEGNHERSLTGDQEEIEAQKELHNKEHHHAYNTPQAGHLNKSSNKEDNGNIDGKIQKNKEGDQTERETPYIENKENLKTPSGE